MIATEQTKQLDDLHFEHKLWRTQLEFNRQEIKIYIRRLEELVGKKRDRDMLAHAEHFQNQFIRQNEVIDELYHDTKAHENNIQRLNGAGGVAILTLDELYENHEKLHDSMHIFRKIYDELKNEFSVFIARWM